MRPDSNHKQSKPTFISRLLSVLIKTMILLMLLFVFDKLLPTISQQTQSFVMAKWQQLSLLQQPITTAAASRKWPAKSATQKASSRHMGRSS